MSNFQKPENALNKCQALKDVGKPTDALEALRVALSTRRFRYAWTPAMEEIMKTYINLCGQLQKIRLVKDGLTQYRAICQLTNMQSFENSIRYFCSFSEARVQVAATKLSDSKGIEDLDDLESPQTLISAAFTLGGVTGTDQLEERSARDALKDLWDTYRTCLETCRHHSSLELVYHEIAAKACNFCLTYNRKSEFKRLCDLLRSQYSYLPKQATASVVSGSAMVSSNNPETISRVFVTRSLQLKISMTLGLSSCAYQLVEDLHSLLQKRKPTVLQLKTYFGLLSEVLWCSNLFQHRYLFHSYAKLRYFVLSKQLQNTSEDHSSTSKSELSEEEDVTVLAVLASCADSLAPQHMLDFSASDFSVNSEKTEKICFMLCSSGRPSSSEEMLNEVISREIHKNCSPLVQKIFSLMTSSEAVDDDESLSYKIKSLLGSLAQSDTLRCYVQAICRAVAVRTIKKISRVYQSIPFGSFSDQIGVIGNFSEIERILIFLRKAKFLDFKIDYIKECVYFFNCIPPTTTTTTSAISLALQIPTWVPDESDIVNFQKILWRRREKIQEIHQADERKQEDKIREDERRAKELEEEKKAAERRWEEEEAKRREAEAEARIRTEREREKAKELEERLKALTRNANIPVSTSQENKPLSAVVHELEKKLAEQCKKEKFQKLQQRKAEFKRVNLVAKVLKSEEGKVLGERYRERIRDEDRESMAGAKAELEKVIKRTEDMKRLLKPNLSMISHWMNEQIQTKKLEHDEKITHEKDIYVHAQLRSIIEDVFDRWAVQDDDDNSDVLKVSQSMSREDFKRNSLQLEAKEDAE